MLSTFKRQIKFSNVYFGSHTKLQVILFSAVAKLTNVDDGTIEIINYYLGVYLISKSNTIHTKAITIWDIIRQYLFQLFQQ
jgi:hypothetical protein